MSEFTNEFGQVIRPGDDVVIVTTGYNHSVSVTKGKFVRVNENNRVQCEVPYEKYIYLDLNDNPVDYYYARRYNIAGNFKIVSSTRITTLILNRVYKLG